MAATKGIKRSTKNASLLRLPPNIRCAVSPTGNYIACANRTRLQLFRRQDGKVVLEAPVKDAIELSFCDEERLLALDSHGDLSMHAVGAKSVAWRQQVCDEKPTIGVVCTPNNEVRVACGAQIVVLDADVGRVLRRDPLPANVTGLARCAGRVVVVHSQAETKRVAISALAEGRIEPLFELEPHHGYLGLRAVSPSGRYLYGFHGLYHTLVDLSERRAYPLHKGLRSAGAFLDDRTFLEACPSEIAVAVAPRWERKGAIAFTAEDVAASLDGAVIAVVGSAKGFVWTREELLAQCMV